MINRLFNIIIAFLIPFSINSYLYAQWSEISYDQNSLRMYGASITENGNIYFIINNIDRTRSVLKTNKTGINWEESVLYIDDNGFGRLTSIDFPDSLNGYVVGGKGKIFKTEDSGTTWIDISVSSGQDFYDVEFLNDSTGFISGQKIKKTVDSGESWNEVFSSTGNIEFVTDSIGFILTSNQYIYKSIDQGETWKEIQLTKDENTVLNDIHFVSDSIGYVIENSYNSYVAKLYRTTDQGSTWNSIDLLGYETFSDVGFESDSIGYIIGADSVFLKTIDAGNTWKSLDDYHPFHGGLIVFEFGLGVITGSSKGESIILINSENFVEILNSEETENKNDRRLDLSQNYPNPFNPTTTINFSLKKADRISLTVYDITGRLVSKLITEKAYSSGIHQIVFNGSYLSSGVYIYKLEASEEVITRMFTLVK